LQKEKFKILIIPAGQRDLDRIRDKKTLISIKKALIDLADNTRPANSIKLYDKLGGYRIRIGNFRCCYRIDDTHKSVYVYRIKHRKDVYR
jgi:mRNA interferase RelE/StbE